MPSVPTDLFTLLQDNFTISMQVNYATAEIFHLEPVKFASQAYHPKD